MPPNNFWNNEMKKKVILVFGMMLLVGCSAKYNAAEVTKNTEQLIKNKKVLIAQPENGTYDAKVYSQSGAMTAMAVRTAFSRYTDDAAVISTCATQECLQNSQQMKDGYYVIPQILHWEDRATEWSGLPDKIEVKITVYNAQSNNVIASTILNGRSKWLTFGGDHPQDLLPQPINEYVASLY